MKKIKKLFILFSVFFCFLLVSCEKEIYTVTFENENGDFVKSVEVYEGNAVSKPDSVEEFEGYTFSGWYLDGVEYSFESKVENNITLIAKYTPNHYTLSFGDGVDPIVVTFGKPIGELPNIPYDENSDNGVWLLDGVILTSTTIYNYTEDKQAVANYSERLCVVSFATETAAKQIISYGDKAIEPRAPQKEGYDFAGWYYEDVRFDFDTPIMENITLQPHWKPRSDTSYSVNVFTEVGNDYVDISDKYARLLTGLVGTTESVVDITEIAQKVIPNNYVLNNEKSTLEGTVLGDGSLVLSVYCDIVRYTVSFAGADIENQVVKLGGTVSKPSTPEKEGYVFYSWLLGENEYDFSSKVSGNITLTANWLEDKDQVVIFDSKIGLDFKPLSLVNGNKIAEPGELEKEGYDFLGWYLGDEAWNFETTLSSEHSKNINLEARWEACKYELSFDEVGVESIVVTYGQPIGQLPNLTNLDSNRTGHWTIAGEEINAKTVWSFSEDKQANSKYFVDMLSQTLDLSTRGDLNLSEQLLKVLDLENESVTKITVNGKEISKSFLDDIEDNATDEESRKRTIVANIGNTEYKLNVFFATKVIYTYEELTRIQEYGGVTTAPFPVDLRYTMYGYSGYFVLGNDIDASPSMTKTYKIATMGRYDSQTWDTEMIGFVGVFDGRGHTIDKLHTASGGLLGDVLGGSIIRNFALTNAKIVEGNVGAGILCFIFSYATLENVYIDFTTTVNMSGIFGRMNKAGTIRNVVVKYKNAGVTGGVLSSWQVKTTQIPYPVFENVSFIYEKGTAISRMKAIGNSTYTASGIKEYILQEDGSMLFVKTKVAGDKDFTSYKTSELKGNEFDAYDEKYWDLSGIYPVFK